MDRSNSANNIEKPSTHPHNGQRRYQSLTKYLSRHFKLHFDTRLCKQAVPFPFHNSLSVQQQSLEEETIDGFMSPLSKSYYTIPDIHFRLSEPSKFQLNGSNFQHDNAPSPLLSCFFQPFKHIHCCDTLSSTIRSKSLIIPLSSTPTRLHFPVKF